MAFQSGGAPLDLDVSMVNKWVHILTPILQTSLEKYMLKSNLEDVDFQYLEEYIMDGSSASGKTDENRLWAA